MVCLGLSITLGCQTAEGPSDPDGHALEAAGKCKSNALDRAKAIFPPSPDPRRGTVEDLCKNILDGRVDPDLGADQLHVLAYQAWQDGEVQVTQGNSTVEQSLAAFNAAVRGLAPVAALDGDEQPIWNVSNLTGEEVVAGGPGASGDDFCFPGGTWCFRVVSDEPYFFMAEAKADQTLLGVCPGDLANDCERDRVHMDVNPDSAIDEDDPDTPLVDENDPDTFVVVWSCTDFGNLHARFGITAGGSIQAGEFGEPVFDAPPAGLNDCGASAFELNGIQRYVWTSLKPLRWAFGAEPLNAAGSSGTKFGRASDVSAGDAENPRTRDLICEVQSRFASVSEGTQCDLFTDSSKTTQLAHCVTSRVSQKIGRCTWEDVPVPDDVIYWGKVEKVINPSTSHQLEMQIPIGPGNPQRGDTRTYIFDIRTR
jgi:hypothetical protein